VAGAVARQARALKPTFRALIQSVRESPAVAPHETGCRVDGHKAWLWTFVGEEATVYLIASGRGYEDAKVNLGRGVLRRARARRLGSLPPFRARLPSELLWASAPPGERDD